ncbi:MAG TPA: hypothetical protein ENI64_12180 [Gammaproteobacteria bacterium]|nr:hypothetical protein [Gammaproteobacteria bacterium]
MPAARITDAINCGGKIVVGSGNVLIGDSPPSGSPLAPGEWDDYIAASSTAQNPSPIQDQQMRADMAVKYRGKAAATESWKTYYSDMSPKDRPAPSSVQNPAQRTGLEQANSTPPTPAPTLPKPAQQQVIDNAGQQMVQAIKNLAEGEMVTPEILSLASTMLQAGTQSNKTTQSTGSEVPGKVLTPTQQDIKLAEANGSTPQQIVARKKVARNYLENNGFTKDQIADALGSSDGTRIGGIDLNKPVEVMPFPPPDTMAQYVKSHGYPGNWFDPKGNQSADSLGISGEGRKMAKFTVPQGTGLLSYSKPILDNWTNSANPIQTKGGGQQLLINDKLKKRIISINKIGN